MKKKITSIKRTSSEVQVYTKSGLFLFVDIEQMKNFSSRDKWLSDTMDNGLSGKPLEKFMSILDELDHELEGGFYGEDGFIY